MKLLKKEHDLSYLGEPLGSLFFLYKMVYSQYSRVNGYSDLPKEDGCVCSEREDQYKVKLIRLYLNYTGNGQGLQ